MALADKVDTVAGLFAAGEKPTGSRDLHEGRQYVVTAIGGSGFPGELVAYRLPGE